MFNSFEVSQRNFQLSVENNRFALVSSFALLCSVIGPEKSRHSINQLNSKLTPIMTWSPAFSRAPWAVCVILVWISIGSSRYLIFFRVAVVLTLVLVLRQSSIEERSIYNWVHRQTTLCVLGYNNCWYETNKSIRVMNKLWKLPFEITSGSENLNNVSVNQRICGIFFFSFMGRFKLLFTKLFFGPEAVEKKRRHDLQLDGRQPRPLPLQTRINAKLQKMSPTLRKAIFNTAETWTTHATIV